jgi:uncharacterized protein (DUF2267 family)
MKFWASWAMILTIAGAAWAQAEGGMEEQPAPQDKPEEKPTEVKPAAEDPYKWVEASVKRLAERAGLTEEQIGKVTERLKASLQEIAKVRETATKELEELLGEETFKKAQRDLARILTGENRGGGGRGPQDMARALFDRMKEELGLSEEQLGKIQPLADEMSAKVRELFEEARKEGRDGFRGLGEKIRPEMDGFVEKVKENLTDDQKAKLDELMKNMRDRMGGRRRGGGGGGDGGGQGE